MDLQAILYLFAMVLAAVSAFVNPTRVNLLALAVAFAAAGLLAGVIA